MLTFAGGGWVLVLVGIVCLGLLAWALAPAMMRSFNRPPGDGKTLDSYGFDLSNLSVARDLIVPAMLHRDMVPAMTDPSATGPDDAIAAGSDPEADRVRWETMQRRSEPKYGKYLVPSDRVIGVVISGVARAYPISTMYVHEIVNDRLGPPGSEVPIAVTHHWPCDSTVVFDRRVQGGRGSVVEFAVSGLLYNSNLLMYDRNEFRAGASVPRHGGGGESLWSQLLAAPISGRALELNESLAMIPCEIATWGDWSARHPQTTVLDRQISMAARYKKAAPTQYFNSDELLAPVRPLPPSDSLDAKTPVLAVSAGGQRRVYPIPFMMAAAAQPLEPAQPMVYADALGDVRLEFVIDRGGHAVRVQTDPPGQAIEIVHALWFAWHAMHPEDTLAGN